MTNLFTITTRRWSNLLRGNYRGVTTYSTQHSKYGLAKRLPSGKYSTLPQVRSKYGPGRVVSYQRQSASQPAPDPWPVSVPAAIELPERDPRALLRISLLLRISHSCPTTVSSRSHKDPARSPSIQSFFLYRPRPSLTHYQFNSARATLIAVFTSMHLR